jgi:hypothetical protein
VELEADAYSHCERVNSHVTPLVTPGIMSDASPATTAFNRDAHVRFIINLDKVVH